MSPTVILGNFEWDSGKAQLNEDRHGVEFIDAVLAFYDPLRIISIDTSHSDAEVRFFCIGKLSEGVLTVRFTFRNSRIRIIGAGYWRKGRGFYEKENIG